MDRISKIGGMIVMAAVLLFFIFPNQASAGGGCQWYEGDIIKFEGISSVYLVGAYGVLHPFSNGDVYHSWYKDFTVVKEFVSGCARSLSGHSIGDPVLHKPGSVLVKSTVSSKVYAVAVGEKLYHIKDPVAAEKVYGPHWTTLIRDVPDYFFTYYDIQDEPLGGVQPIGGLMIRMDYGFGNPGGVYYGDGEYFRQVSGSLDDIALRDVRTVEPFEMPGIYLENRTLPLPSDFHHGISRFEPIVNQSAQKFLEKVHWGDTNKVAYQISVSEIHALDTERAQRSRTAIITGQTEQNVYHACVTESQSAGLVVQEKMNGVFQPTLEEFVSTFEDGDDVYYIRVGDKNSGFFYDDPGDLSWVELANTERERTKRICVNNGLLIPSLFYDTHGVQVSGVRQAAYIGEGADTWVFEFDDAKVYQNPTYTYAAGQLSEELWEMSIVPDSSGILEKNSVRELIGLFGDFTTLTMTGGELRVSQDTHLPTSVLLYVRGVEFGSGEEVDMMVTVDILSYSSRRVFDRPM